MIIIAGRQEAKFYVAQDGRIELEEEINIPNPDYTDREGFFGRNSPGMTASGSVYEEKKDYVLKRFEKAFRAFIDGSFRSGQFTHVMIFAPDFMKNILSENLPATVKKKISLTLSGNYTKMHPFKILGLVKKLKERPWAENGDSRADKLLGRKEALKTTPAKLKDRPK